LTTRSRWWIFTGREKKPGRKTKNNALFETNFSSLVDLFRNDPETVPAYTEIVGIPVFQQGENKMVIQFRKIQVILILVLLLGIVVPFQSAQADAGGVVTPQDLVNQGWVCVYRFGQYAYCMNPNFTGLGPTTIMNKTFLVSDASFSNPVYLGSSIFIRADKYADQPCPTNESPDWMLVLGGMYYQCRHFEKDYP
jgi:hypothetical protein